MITMFQSGKHKDNSIRKFADENDEYLNRWDLLE